MLMITYQNNLIQSEIMSLYTDRKNVNEYLLNRKKFLKYLLLLVHMTSGASVRGTEILTIKYRNTLNNKMRNVFFDEKASFYD
jgi:hypothetical protein